MKLTSLFRRWLAEGNDSALRVTGIRQVFTGYDEQKATRGYERSRRHTATGRPIGAARPQPVPFRKASER